MSTRGRGRGGRSNGLHRPTPVGAVSSISTDNQQPLSSTVPHTSESVDENISTAAGIYSNINMLQYA